jgi:hypothetical protein
MDQYKYAHVKMIREWEDLGHIFKLGSIYTFLSEKGAYYSFWGGCYRIPKNHCEVIEKENK